MTNDERMPKSEFRKAGRAWFLFIRHRGLFRHSSFVIWISRPSLPPPPQYLPLIPPHFLQPCLPHRHPFALAVMIPHRPKRQRLRLFLQDQPCRVISLLFRRAYPRRLQHREKQRPQHIPRPDHPRRHAIDAGIEIIQPNMHQNGPQIEKEGPRRYTSQNPGPSRYTNQNQSSCEYSNRTKVLANIKTPIPRPQSIYQGQALAS